MMPWAWAVRNCRQVGPQRRGAGSMPDGTQNPAGWNATGKDMLDEILTNPGSVTTQGYGRIGGKWQDTVDIRLPSGLGARFTKSESFSGFLD
jgi:hypothetical protein